MRDLVRELSEGHRAVEAAIGRGSGLFRPPKGYLDLRVATAIRVAGLGSWLWSVDPNDWCVGVTADDVVAGCEGIVAGDVVLLHDGVVEESGLEGMDRSATLEAVPRIVEQIRASGLALTALAM
jgi:peptidoglycan/xylan/chitin deacetylase (PgdA/CDA1 family)